MDGTLAINNNLNALKRILAGLVAMARLGQPAIASRQSAAADGGTHPDCPLPTADCHPTLPRHLRLAILRLLRPAESAARRLIIAAARGLTVTLPPARPFKPKPFSPELTLRRFGIAVTLSPASILPRSRGTETTLSLSKGGGGGARATFPLLDPLRRFQAGARRTVPPHAAPRILLPGIAEPHRLPPPPSRDDPVDATRLNLRLAALAAALDDIEGQALRFARWQARRRQSRSRRTWPLRPGRPPGGRLARYDPSALPRDAVGAQSRNHRRVRDVDEILAHAHSLALHALQRHDTS